VPYCHRYIVVFSDVGGSLAGQAVHPSLPPEQADPDVVGTGALVSVAGKGRLYMTDITLQGDGIDRMQGLRILNAGMVYAYGASSLQLQVLILRTQLQTQGGGRVITHTVFTR
jgi:hypothetical protein